MSRRTKEPCVDGTGAADARTAEAGDCVEQALRQISRGTARMLEELLRRRRRRAAQQRLRRRKTGARRHAAARTPDAAGSGMPEPQLTGEVQK